MTTSFDKQQVHWHGTKQTQVDGFQHRNGVKPSEEARVVPVTTAWSMLHVVRVCFKCLAPATNRGDETCSPMTCDRSRLRFGSELIDDSTRPPGFQCSNPHHVDTGVSHHASNASAAAKASVDPVSIPMPNANANANANANPNATATVNTDQCEVVGCRCHSIASTDERKGIPHVQIKARVGKGGKACVCSVSESLTLGQRTSHMPRGAFFVIGRLDFCQCRALISSPRHRFIG